MILMLEELFIRCEREQIIPVASEHLENLAKQRTSPEA